MVQSGSANSPVAGVLQSALWLVCCTQALLCQCWVVGLLCFQSSSGDGNGGNAVICLGLLSLRSHFFYFFGLQGWSRFQCGGRLGQDCTLFN